jgi:hypothetical protein
MENLSPEAGFFSLPSLLEPDTITPEQFYGPRTEGIGGGERRLMAAVLADGVEAYLHYWKMVSGGFVNADADARDWVDTKNYTYPFSFDLVCQSLGINPSYLRLGL